MAEFLFEQPEGEANINYLLYIETLKRTKDDEKEIMKTIAHKFVKHQERMIAYLELYQRYVSLLKILLTREHLIYDTTNILKFDPKAVAVDDLIKKIENCMNSEIVDVEVLSAIKNDIAGLESFSNVKQKFVNTSFRHSHVKGIDENLKRIGKVMKNAIDLLMEKIISSFEDLSSDS